MKPISIASLFFMMFSLQGFAGEAYSNRCGSSLLNMLYRLESKEDDFLEISDLRFSAPPSAILADHNLVMPPAKFHKNIKNFYRVPSIAKKGRMLFNKSNYVGTIPDKDFSKLLKPNTYYTYILQDDKISFAKTRPGIMRNYGSKHAFLTDQSKSVKMAGEAWLDEKGVFHFDNNSGTFKPNQQHVANAQRFFHDYLGTEKVEGHMWTPPEP